MLRYYERMQVKTRFPPENSGHIHIGHAKAAYSNYKFAKINGGTMMIRFDDTNPNNCKKEYADSILEDLRTLGLADDTTEISNTSIYFDQLQNYAVTMIENGHAYVDNTSTEQIRQNRKTKTESTSRNNSVEVNLLRWKKLLTSTDVDNLVLRAKINMRDKNACMRDPVLYRRCTKEHYLTKTKYNAYPTYDFSCPILDSIENITHTFRTVEYADRTDLYFWVLDKLSLRKPVLQLFSSLRFDHTVMSKRKIKLLIDTGTLEGWNDPRLCTIKGLIRRGITAESILKYVDTMYLSSNNTRKGTYSMLLTINARILENKSGRYVAVEKSDAYTATFDPPIDEHTRSVNLHPKFPEIGKKNMHVSNNIYLEGRDAKTLTVGEEITLMNLGNAIVTNIHEHQIVLSPNFAGDFKLTKKKLHWLSTADCCEIQINEYDHILKTEKLILNDDKSVSKDCIRIDSHKIINCYAETSLLAVDTSHHVQLMRRGFHVVDGAKRLVRLPDSGSVNSFSVYF